MLSKIVSSKDSSKLQLDHYTIPTVEEVGMIISDKKRDLERIHFVEEHKEDPVKAAKNEANKILIEAQTKLKEAEMEANVLKNRKEKELRMQLEKEFHLKLEAEVKKLQQNYLDALEELAVFKQTLYKKSENQLMHLVFSVTKKVIAEEVKTNSDIIVSMLKKGFEKIKDLKECEIKINPADYATIAAKKAEVSDILRGAGNVKFTKDETIERGGCQIVSPYGEISSEPTKQLDIIMRELFDGA